MNPAGAMVMDVAEFHRQRRYVQTPSGRIAFVEQGSGPVALFLHGVPLNGFHWRHILAGLSDVRRGIALDLMSLGYTEIGPDQDVSFTGQAHMVAQFLDALKIDKIDLVSNDSGGAVAQIFAAHYPHRLRSLTLTNCDTHDNWPPPQILPRLDAARQGTLADAYGSLLGNQEAAHVRLSIAWANPKVLTDEILHAYFDPFLASAERKHNFHRYWLSFDNAQTLRIESKLRELRVPTLIVWGLDDVFFPVQWAYWLRDTIPGAVKVVEVPGAKLFFPEDQPAALLEPLRAFLANPGA